MCEERRVHGQRPSGEQGAPPELPRDTPLSHSGLPNGHMNSAASGHLVGGTLFSGCRKPRQRGTRPP